MHEPALAVRLHEREVGRILRFPGDRYLFSFTEAYVRDRDRPTLSLAYKGEFSADGRDEDGGLVTSLRAWRSRLPPFFANLLPEGHLRRYLARRARVRERDDYGLLAALGADLPGAITVVAAGAEDVGGGAEEDRHSGPLRFSLAGVQLKVSAQMDASGRLTMRADGGGGSWIVKLPTAAFPGVSENEFAMLELARAVGIDVPQARLVPAEEIANLPRGLDPGGGKALAVRRFDRESSGGKVHMEDFAQVFGLYPEDKYEKRSFANIAAVLSSEAGSPAVDEFMRRLIFSVITGNGDMHLKNWSLIYPDGRTPALAPAYDLLSTIPYLPRDGLALTFGGERSLERVSQTQVRRLADRARLAVSPLWDITTLMLERTLPAWEALPARSHIPGPIADAIGRHIHKVSAQRVAR